MNSLPIQNKPTLIITMVIGIISVLLVLLVLISFFTTTINKGDDQPNVSNPPGQTRTQARSVPEGNPRTIQSSDIYKKSVSEIAEKNKTPLQRDALVAKLLDTLPHKGKYFSIDYSYATNVFTTTIDSTNRAVGNEELDQFLRQNKIESRDWIKNLKLTYQ